MPVSAFPARRTCPDPSLLQKTAQRRGLDRARVPVWILQRKIRRAVKIGLTEPKIAQRERGLHAAGKGMQRRPRAFGTEKVGDRRKLLCGRPFVVGDGMGQDDRMGFGMRQVEAAPQSMADPRPT